MSDPTPAKFQQPYILTWVLPGKKEDALIVDISKIIIKDRIRKDFGNIQELADDIKTNGLINPPVINKNYELLAGERRLRACKALGWQQIEVRMMDTRDAEHELNVEISENDARKDFTKSERVDYMKRLLRIEAAKAEERMKNPSQNSDEGRADEKTAKQFDISRDTMRKEITIADNRDLLSDEDFADWDEGRLSTNKAFQRIKARQKEVEEENSKLRTALSESETKRILAEQRGAKEVVPSDYEDAKERAAIAEKDFKILRGQYDEMAEKWKKAESEKEALLTEMKRPENERAEKIKKSALFFCAGVANFIEKYGGYIWLTDEINSMEPDEREGYLRAIGAMDAWVQQMKENLNYEEEI